jgi:toxin FitB
MILDSNIIIYAAQPQNEDLRTWIATQAVQASALSQLEVLGYHQITETDRELFIEFFATVPTLPITQPVIDCKVEVFSKILSKSSGSFF